MRYLVMGLIVALAIAGLWRADGLANAQSSCASQGAVSSDNTALVADCEMLLSARDTLEGAARLNWSASTPIEDWEGISIGGAPLRVVGIALSERGLTGTIPSELGSLSNLGGLYLGGNSLSGTIPPELGSLSRLAVLSLWGNELSGTIPAQLGDLSNLLWLYLDRNQLSGTIPAQLGNLSNLLWLYLDRNQLSGSIPAQLGNLSNLTSLVLSENQLTGQIPAELGRLSNLTRLDLWGNQLSGTIPTELDSLSNLAVLNLSGNELTGCIPDELRDVEFNDFDSVGLPFCDPQLPGPPNVSVIWVGARLVRIDSPTPVTATFSEPVFGFTVDDVDVVNGSASNLVGIDGDSMYTFDVIPNAIGVVTVDIAGNVAQDADGNGNTAAVQLSLGIPYDDDGDGKISRDEVITAIGDFLFSGTLIRDHVIELIGLFLFG